ncbi:hypothetical protein GLOTRDRAFT_94965 [Gloeophyllum trabeum ATCC 11539]|uniref:DDE-1 domain-containing protein n=1 Tax=Gloeophyllum trabeum (strain ATCC 11539 / FP-39264 / Madison 617) TaxID=670483 RepID=S7RM97_GLOTA|nr:uncharacterized protein GLOTRDRAFT_94965 [Gloeophyllum trabeum ATCC 11539]EPQ53839.1 hypothetical protein GLOTRDRAFT_94965 [Gloeophyllum trabeum ATCC 11539]
MVGRPQSQSRKAQLAREEHDPVMDRAIDSYRAELDKTDPEKKKSLRTICEETLQVYFEETGHTVTLNHKTLSNLVNGGWRLAEFNASKSWLTPAEVDQVAARGFPLSHRRLCEHVNEICQAKYGDSWRPEGLGDNWTHRFVEKHSDWLAMYKPHALDASRARAVNPHATAEYYRLLEELQTTGDYGWPILDENTYGVDESGFQSGLGQSNERAIGGRGKKVQHEQRDGNRENVTVIVTICADGSSDKPSPTVIFKGSCFQSNWCQDNPTNASYAPFYITHCLQGLDVAFFSLLKDCWNEEQAKWERQKGRKVTKENFLLVYGNAHLHALTQELVRTAFCKTGVAPFNPKVITPEMMAPSLETSTQPILPIAPATPIHAVSKLIRAATAPAKDGSAGVNQPGLTMTPIREALTKLEESSAQFLVTSSPVRSDQELPQLPICPVSPIRHQGHSPYQVLLDAEPQTERERLLQLALQASEARAEAHKQHVLSLQAAAVLHTQYLSRVRAELQAQKEKKAKGKGFKLMGDGMPKVLTNDDFIEKVKERDRLLDAIADEKEARKQARDEYQLQMAEWRNEEDARKARNDAKTAEYRKRLAEYKAESEKARREKRRIQLKKPSRGPLEKAKAKPKLNAQSNALADVSEGDATGSEDEDD